MTPDGSSAGPAGADTTRIVRRHRSSSLASLAVLAVVVTTLAAPVAAGLAAGPAGAAADAKARDPMTIAQEKLDAARQAATDAAAKLSQAETARAQVGDEIAGLEQEIPQLQAREAELRVIVKVRAAALYMRGGAPRLESFVGATDALAAAGASHLTNVVTAHDVDLAAELRATTAKLQVREASLRTKKAELDQTVAAITATRDDLDRKLAIASAAYDKVRVALAAQRAAGTGTALLTGAMRCPVDGFTVFADDFGEARDGGTTHEGIDMAAVLETPLVAVADGDIVHDESPAGGHGIWLYDAQGDGYYYAHLSRYEGDPRHVAAGDVVGYVGVTGVTTGPHLHFEYHPGRAEAVDPYALLLSLCVDEMALPKPKSG
jgi:murein DD-endopeptidase MepM/ murein hydrolase activator NlpD